MGKTLKIICLLIITVLSIFASSVLRDKAVLGTQVIRLHVVANSDSDEDQARKLQVRDAIMAHLESNMTGIDSSEAAKAYLQNNLKTLETVAQDTLACAGCDDTVRITLTREAFDTREYDDFALPAGVYESLRIRIGKAEGKNWWCVVFPSLCMSAVDTNSDVSVFSDTLSSTITQEKGYEIRFFLLDWLGQIENFFSLD